MRPTRGYGTAAASDGAATAESLRAVRDGRPDDPMIVLRRVSAAAEL